MQASQEAHDAKLDGSHIILEQTFGFVIIEKNDFIWISRHHLQGRVYVLRFSLYFDTCILLNNQINHVYVWKTQTNYRDTNFNLLIIGWLESWYMHTKFTLTLDPS